VLAIVFPQIDPVLFRIGPVATTWYGLSYALGLIICIYLFQKLDRNREKRFSINSICKDKIDSLLVYSIIGIVLGGRLGYVSFYRSEWFVERPLMVFNTMEGGMSFHGATIGLIISFAYFCNKHKISFLHLTDLVCSVVPIGLFLGRCANFINGELYGRVTDLSWGMLFPGAGNLPRHPSQLYEAASEGIILFIIMISLFFFTKIAASRGHLTGAFLIGYSIARTVIENFREPDLQNGSFMVSIWHNYEITKGQLLTFPMLVYGVVLLLKDRK